MQRINIIKDEDNIDKFYDNGLIVITPKVFNDDRGYFFESFKKDTFDKYSCWMRDNISKPIFIQENESKSCKNVVRGLHYQYGEYAQAKLVRVVVGKIIDVVLDLRKTSPTFKQLFAIELSGDNKKQFFIPRGFAHGFISLTNNTIFQYKCDNYWNKQSERGVLFTDVKLNILNQLNIKNENLIFSDKDKVFPGIDDVSDFSKQ